MGISNKIDSFWGVYLLLPIIVFVFVVYWFVARPKPETVVEKIQSSILSPSSTTEFHKIIDRDALCFVSVTMFRHGIMIRADAPASVSISCVKK